MPNPIDTPEKKHSNIKIELIQEINSNKQSSYHVEINNIPVPETATTDLEKASIFYNHIVQSNSGITRNVLQSIEF